MNLMQRLVISNLFGFGFVALSWVAVILIYENVGKSWIVEPSVVDRLRSSHPVGCGLPLPGHPVEAGAPSGSSEWSFIALVEPLAHAYKRCVTNRFPRVDTGNRVSDGLCGAERS